MVDEWIKELLDQIRKYFAYAHVQRGNEFIVKT